MKKKDREIIRRLQERYPDAGCELDFGTPFQLLAATLLSAQTTDVQVNKVTEGLFREYPDVYAWLDLSVPEIEDRIRSIGLFRTKAKNLYQLSRELIHRFQGEVPQTMEELITLPGVGRKTANVVLANAFGVPTIAVDTHVFRLANRIGLTNEKDVEKTEQALMKALDRELWIAAHHLLIFHGRRTCMARSPKCEQCGIQEYCKYYKQISKTKNKNKQENQALASSDAKDGRLKETT